VKHQTFNPRSLWGSDLYAGGNFASAGGFNPRSLWGKRLAFDFLIGPFGERVGAKDSKYLDNLDVLLGT